MSTTEESAAPAFALNRQMAKVAHVNMREEKHGEESVTAVDVKIQTDVSNDFLSYLSPTLKWSLYDKPENPDLADHAGHMPRLRYASLAPLKWSLGEVEMVVTIHGAKKKDDVALQGPVKEVRLECKDGGTVSVTFSVSVSAPPAGVVGSLASLLGCMAKVSVMSPEDAAAGGGDE